MEFINKIIEVTFRYNKHMLTFLYNVDSIEDFKLSPRYLRFKQKFGDILVENKLIDDNNEYIQAHATIALFINTKSPSRDDFNVWLDNVLQLFNMPIDYYESILVSLLNLYTSNEQEFIYAASAIVNKEGGGQEITLNTEIALGRKHREYNYIFK